MRSRSCNSGGHARQPALALPGLEPPVYGAGQGFRKAVEAALVTPGFSDCVEFSLGFLDLRAGTGVHPRVIGDVDHILADMDQFAPHREIVDGAAVVGGVDDGGGLGGQTRQILRNGHPAEVLLAEKGLERDRGGELSGANQLAGCLEDAAVQFLGEMFRLQKIGDAVEGVVIDQNGAKKRLFGLDIGWRGAKRRVRRGDGQGLTIKSLFQRCHADKPSFLLRPDWRREKGNRYRERRRITRWPDGYSGMAAPIRKSESHAAPPRPRYPQQRKKGCGPMAIALDRGARDTGHGKAGFFGTNSPFTTKLRLRQARDAPAPSAP